MTEDVTLGELWRQGEQIKAVVDKMDGKLDAAQDAITRHEGEIVRNSSDIKEIKADLRSRRVTTGTIAGAVATVVTVIGEIIGHIH